jgi:hypothetical protein
MFVLQIHRQRLEPAAATRACAILQLCHHAGVHAQVSPRTGLSEDFLVASSKAFKRRKDTGFVPPSEQVHEALLAAEEKLEQDLDWDD